MNSLESIAVYVEVAERGSFTAAARLFGITPTMVANHVRRLEKRLGAVLIERTTRSHRLTDLGTTYLSRCRDVLASVALADRVVDDMALAPRGRLRISAPVSWGTHRLVPVLGAYIEKYPQVEVDLVLNDRVVDLAQDGFDCVMRSGPLNDPSIVARRLKDVHMVVAASPDYLLRCGTPRRPSDLVKHVLLPFATWGRDHALRFKRQTQTAVVPIQGPLTINNGQALLVAALSGLGIIVQSDAMIEPLILSGSLVRLLPRWELPLRAMHLLRLKDARPNSKIRTFVDHVIEQLG